MIYIFLRATIIGKIKKLLILSKSIKKKLSTGRLILTWLFNRWIDYKGGRDLPHGKPFEFGTRG